MNHSRDSNSAAVIATAVQAAMRAREEGTRRIVLQRPMIGGVSRDSDWAAHPLDRFSCRA
jgi:hypothetical protein